MEDYGSVEMADLMPMDDLEEDYESDRGDSIHSDGSIGGHTPTTVEDGRTSGEILRTSALVEDEFDAESYAFGASLLQRIGGQAGSGYRTLDGNEQDQIVHDHVSPLEDELLNGYAYGDSGKPETDEGEEDAEGEDEPNSLWPASEHHDLDDAARFSANDAPGAKPYDDALSAALRQAKEAQSYWSGRGNLGFEQSDAEAKRRKMTLPELPLAREEYDYDDEEEDIGEYGDPMQIMNTATPYFVETPQKSNRMFPDATPEAFDTALSATDPNAPNIDPTSPMRGKRRGRPRGRGSDGGGRVKRGRRSIKWALKGTEHDPDLRRAEARRGRPRGLPKKRGRPPGPRRVDPGPEFKSHQSQAMSAYMDGQLEYALGHVQKAIQANPEVGVAHWLLSEVLRQLGREEDSLRALLSGAVIQNTADMWIQAGDRTMQRDGLYRKTESLQQALYCYSNAVKCAPDESELSVKAREAFRDALLESGDRAGARLQSKAVCRLEPTNFENIMLYAELCAETNDSSEFLRAKIAYENAFEATSMERNDLANVPEAWSHINVYMELLEKLSYTAEAIRMLKRLARWMLGRKDEQFWDSVVSDDCEYDSGHERRAFVGEFQQGKASRDKALYGDGLPLELRVKMGMFRLHMGMQNRSEAIRHFEHLLQPTVDPIEFSDLIFLVATALKKSHVFEAAIPYYERIKDIPEMVPEDYYVGLIECYTQTKRYAAAETACNDLLRIDPQSVQARVKLAAVFDAQGQHDKAIPVLKDVIERQRKKIVTDAAQSLPPKMMRTQRKFQSKPSTENSSTNAEAAHAATPKRRSSGAPRRKKSQQDDLSIERPAPEPKPSKQPKQASVRQPKPPKTDTATLGPKIAPADIASNYERLEALRPALEGVNEAATEAWLSLATQMINTFRSEPAFFRGNRFVGYTQRFVGLPSVPATEQEAVSMLQRLDTNGEEDGTTHSESPTPRSRIIPDDFHGVLFSQWHRMISEVALLYAKQGNQDLCYPLLKNVLLQANVFRQDETLLHVGYAVALSCALQFNDSEYSMDIARWYIGISDFRASMPFQLFGSVARLCYGEDHAMHTNETQKFIARIVKSMDHGVMPQSVRDQIKWQYEILARAETQTKRWGEGSGKLDPGVFVIFGHIMMSSSHQSLNSALPWYIRALALQPQNASTHLALGVTYIFSAMKRQTENRQYEIQQGLAFVQRYYDLRVATGEPGHMQEAEFNMAKMWHMLGLTHLAIPRYEKVLALSKEVKETTAEDFATEAAFALQQIFALAGNEEAAVAIGEQYLVM